LCPEQKVEDEAALIEQRDEAPQIVFSMAGHGFLAGVFVRNAMDKSGNAMDNSEGVPRPAERFGLELFPKQNWKTFFYSERKFYICIITKTNPP
jgi:hypothetical protein